MTRNEIRYKLWYDLYDIVDNCVRDKIGTSEAVDAIMARLEQEQKAKDYNPEAILKILG